MNRKEFLTDNATLTVSAFFLPNNVLKGSFSGNNLIKTNDLCPMSASE
jgi:hypothetical protein